METRKNVILATAIATVLLVAMVGSASADTEITTLPFTTSTDGETYFLSDNLTCANTANAITIANDSVVIDGRGNKITGAVTAGICTGGSESNPVVTHSGVVNDGGYDNVVVKDLEIENFCTGVVMGFSTTDVENMAVTGCKIHDCGDSDSITHGIHLSGAHHSTITKNEIYNIDGTADMGYCGSGGNGICMFGGSTAGKGDWNSITCNHLHNNAKCGLHAKKKCMHNIISYNNASGNHGAGIMPECKKSNFNTIQYNTMSNNGLGGFYTCGNNNTISCNTLIHNGHALPDWGMGLEINAGIKMGYWYGVYNDVINNTVCDSSGNDIVTTDNAQGDTNTVESNTCDSLERGGVVGSCDWSCDSLTTVYYDFDKDGYYSKDPVDCTCNNILDVGACCNPGLFNSSGAAQHCAGGVCILTPGNDPNDCAIQADVTIEPETLNVKSNGEWISAYIELPEDHNVKDIDLNTVFLEDTIPAVTDAQYGFVTDPDSYLVDHDGDGILERMVKFNRTAVIEYLGTYDFDDGDTGNHKSAELFVTGEVAGAPFEGSDTVRVRV